MYRNKLETDDMPSCQLRECICIFTSALASNYRSNQDRTV